MNGRRRAMMARAALGGSPARFRDLRGPPPHELSQGYPYGEPMPPDWEPGPNNGMGVDFPPPGWEQPSDRSEVNRFYVPESQWGDRQQVQLASGSLAPQTGTTNQALQFNLEYPRACMLRLSAVEQLGAIASPTPSLSVLWTIDIGVGRAMQSKPRFALVGPLNGTVDTDIILQLPLTACRIVATVTSLVAAATITEICAQVAPFNKPVLQFPQGAR